MNYLYRYLRLLTPEEREGVRGLHLSERERQVLEVLLEPADPAPVKSAVLSVLGISGSHFDKLCSLLLDKVYSAVVPEGGTALLYDLNRRNLFGHFCHQMKRQEKMLEAAQAPAPQKANFYFTCFSLLQRIVRKDYDDELMRAIGGKYLAAKEGATQGDRLFIDACTIIALMLNAGARGAQNRLADEAEQRLHALDAVAAALREHDHPYAFFHYYRAWSTFYTIIDSRPDIRLRYLERSAALCDTRSDVISEEDRVLTLGRIAEARYNNSEFAVAADLYTRLFSTWPEVLSRDYYHTTKYVQVLVILGRYSEARYLLDERFGVFVENREPAMATMAALSYAKLHLCAGDREQARRYIDLGFGLIEKNFYIQYEIELRMLETAYFYLSGDEEFADTLSGRHVKYLQSRGFTLKNSRFYPWFFVLVQAFLAERAGAKKVSKKLEAKLQEFHSGPAAVYGLLLNALRTCGRRSTAAAPELR